MLEPKQEKRVLFLVNGLGMGNSTRCFSLVEKLSEADVKVDVMTSGNGLLFFEDKKGNQVDRLIETNSVYYGKGKEGKLSIIQTLFSLVNFASSYLKNNRLVESYLDNNKVDAVVIDSEYIFRPIQKRRIPIIALNNSDVVISSFFKLKDKPLNIYPQFFIVELLDFLYHLFIPDKVISPRLKNFVSFGKKIVPVGPIVRKQYLPSSSGRVIKNVVIMLSGSAFGSQVNFKKETFPFKIDVVGREGEDLDGLFFHGKLFDNYELISRADVLVINAGFSAVSEAVFMRKPCIVIPVENHAEQFVNAKNVELMGYGFFSTPENMAHSLKKMCLEIETYRSRIAESEFCANGVEKAFQVLMNFLR